MVTLRWTRILFKGKYSHSLLISTQISLVLVYKIKSLHATYVQDCTQLRNLQILRFFAIFAGQRVFGSVLRNLRIFALLCDAN